MTQDVDVKSVRGIGFDATCSLVALDRHFLPVAVNHTGVCFMSPAGERHTLSDRTCARRCPGEECADVDGPPGHGSSLSDHSYQTQSAPGSRGCDVTRNAAPQITVAQRGEECERHKHSFHLEFQSCVFHSVIRICGTPVGKKRHTSLTFLTFCPGKPQALCAGEPFIRL